jgi:hypothetical protein
MTAAFLLLIAAAQAAPAAQPAPFERLFTDWRSANRQSIEAEREALQRPAPAPAPDSASVPAMSGFAPGSTALGERVGEIVSLGDCAEGERMARAAGDFALLVAVRNHCQDKPQSESRPEAEPQP